MRRIVLLAFALAIGMAGPASAEWKGCYLSAGVGMSATNNTTDLVSDGTWAPPGKVLTIGGLGSSGRLGALGAGCDIQIDKFVVGGFADYAWHDQKFEISSALLPGTLASLDINNQWTVGGRAGVVFGNALVYGLAGYTKVETSGVVVPVANLTLALPAFTGWTFGGGIETPLIENLRISIEYRYTRLDAQSVGLGGGSGLALQMQPEIHTAMARLSYGFNLFK